MKLTQKRKDKLADFMLNMVVASFAVSAFDGNWWGIVSGIFAMVGFFIFTREA